MKLKKSIVSMITVMSVCVTPMPSFVFASEANNVRDFTKISFEDTEEDFFSQNCINSSGTTLEEKGVTDGNKALKIVFAAQDNSKYIFSSNQIKGWDFKDDCLYLDITNPSNDDLQLNISMLDMKEVRTKGTVTIPANKTVKVNVPLASSDTASSFLGIRSLPITSNAGTSAVSFEWIRPGEKRQMADRNSIAKIEIEPINHEKETSLIIDNLRTEYDPYINYRKAFSDIIDEFGQYKENHSERKITSVDDLIKREEKQNDILKEQLEETKERNISSYYGLKDEKYRQDATGHYYTKKINGKWFLIDPEGYPYFASGVDILRPEDSITWTQGREFMYENLPSKNSELGDHYTTVEGCVLSPQSIHSGDGYSFYTANLERKYGDDWLLKWRDTAVERFKAWGFTSIGCWADPNLFYGQGEEFKFPYTAHIWINSDQIPLGGISDPFAPNFENYARKQLQDIKDRGINEDSYCVGIFVDNEQGWGKGFDMNTGDSYVNGSVVKAAFAKNMNDKDAYAKRKLLSYLKDKYSDITKVNEAWGTNLSSWKDIERSYDGVISDDDLSAMLTIIAEKYYSEVSGLVKEYLPNILYLGSRYAHPWGANKEAVDACAKYADVVSFNIYNDVPITNYMEKYFETSKTYDKPLIIGEFHFTSTAYNNYHNRANNALDDKGRGEKYTAYMKAAYDNKYIVGAHWFQYYDQPTTGRAWDGENYNVGFVDVTDQPYEDLVAAAKKINEQAYQISLGVKEERELGSGVTSIAQIGKETTVTGNSGIVKVTHRDNGFYNTSGKKVNSSFVLTDYNHMLLLNKDGKIVTTTRIYNKTNKDMFLVNSKGWIYRNRTITRLGNTYTINSLGVVTGIK